MFYVVHRAVKNILRALGGIGRLVAEPLGWGGGGGGLVNQHGGQNAKVQKKPNFNQNCQI